ncbi:NERD domain-containing protein [Endozoicomonas numazuensis]|uniref:Serine/threonine protein kinase n=1 Tax=Endozoicomonas numazuensis TaxID=1137799 RepID=A0A081NEW5_9GAMM|nr:NERD domain-containing protein [Endozoicomonas numazuensis]KEQ16988.1 serine/threonine protein kinase [Endozoicomonas numazuensis]
MAKQISFGNAVNDAERWAFKLLSNELPQNYLLLTNIEIPVHTGQAMEVDALIIGEWGIYVVDIKGYIGRLNAGQHAWSLDGRDVDNCLAKANYVARVLAGKIKHKIPVGVYAPWCQGMVFVTGRKGEGISLEKDDGSLSIYTPQQIVSALTHQWGLTAPKKFPVTEKQKEHVLETLGQVSVVERRNNRIQDFHKVKCLFIQHGLEIWQADYQPGDWSAPWLLKILVSTGFENEEMQYTQEQKLRDEFMRLQKLSGCNGVPYSAPLIQDGEQLVLPIKMPRGVPLSAFKPQEHTTYQLLEALKHSALALQQIHRRGYTVGNWSENCVFITDDGDIEYIDIINGSTLDEDIKNYATLFCSLAKQTHQPRIYQWYEQAALGRNLDLDWLCCDLSALIEMGICDGEQKAISLKKGAIIDHHFQLEECIQTSETSQLWRAKHLQGQYNCGISIYQCIDEHWPELSCLYRSLSHLFHPHIERVIAFGQLPASQDLFIARYWLKGCSLNELIHYEEQQPQMWFAQLLTGLQYLHRMNIFHGAVCPRNIICNPVRAVLVNFGVGLDIAAESYSQQYADPNLWAEENDIEKDLYGLVASFVDVLTPISLNNQRSRDFIIKALDAIDPNLVGQSLFESCQRVLSFNFSPDLSESYLTQFGLDPSSL